MALHLPHFEQKRLLAALLAAVVLGTASPAAADDKAACLDAVSKAQHLRGNHQLVEAREQLKRCAATTCPPVIASDCTNWLAEVDRSLPTVVVTARNAAGSDLVDVTVTVDGQPLLSKLDGHAIPMDAGPHAFHFESPDGTVDREVLIREGEKDQAVAVVLGTAAAPAPAPHQAVEPSSSFLGTVGWIAAGVGAGGLVVGGVAGGIALRDKNSDCRGNACQPGTSAGIRSAALVSDVGWIAGGLLLASGTALILVAPRGGGSGTGRLLVAPSIAFGAGGVVMAGSF